MADIDPRDEPQPVVPLETVETTTEIVETPPVIVETPPLANEVATVVAHKRPRNVYSGMWGPLEIGVAAAAGLALLFSFAVYFFFVVPSSRELAHNKSEAERLEAEYRSADTKYGEIRDTETQVGKILGSVDDFETRFLPTVSTGQAALYQRLNGLIRGYGLVNTTGPDYSPLETADQGSNQQSDQEKGRSKYRSLYPGVYVTMTVEGSYQNLRRFIREIETGGDFIIISAIELAPSDNEASTPNEEPKVKPINPNPIKLGPNGLTQAPDAAGGIVRQKGKAHGEYLALHIEMAAYFRRPGSVPMTATETTEQ